MTEANLWSIAEGLAVWLPRSFGWGLANCGVLAGGSTAAWIDTPYDTALAGDFYQRCRPLLGDAEVDWLLCTHGNGDHLWGAGVLPHAKVVYTRETSDHIAHEPSPAQLHALVHDSDPSSLLGWYFKRHFGRYDWATTTLPEPTITFTGEMEIAVGRFPVQLIQVGPAHTVGDMIVYLPRQEVCFSGDVIFAASAEQPGDHPVHWAGPLDGIMAACQKVLDTGARVIVPGHGPLLDRAGVLDHLTYLEYLRDRSHELHARGVPVEEAARRILAEGRYPDLHLPERLVITVGSEFRHLDGGPAQPMLDRITQLAQLAWALENPGMPTPHTGPTTALLQPSPS